MSLDTQPVSLAPEVPAEIPARPFDNVWLELERRHGWRVEVAAYDNPRPAVSRMPFCFQDFDNRFAAEFRVRNRLDEVVAGAKSEWDAILKLRHWVFVQLVNGTDPAVPGLEPATLLAASRSGGTFFCTHFATVFVAAAAALGIPARKLAVDGEHLPTEASNMHGVADVWVNELRKWVCVDPNYDHHYELDGVPLNAEEVGRRWQTHRGEGIVARVGPENRAVPRARTGIAGKPEACALFWHLIECRNDVFRRDGRGGKPPVVLPLDEARKRQRWYQGKPPKTFEHKRYASGTFLFTEELADAYPDLDAAHFEILPPHKMPYYGRVQFYTPCAPYFSHYEVRVDDGTPERIEGMEYPWRLHPGRCRFEVRTVSVMGRQGPAYSMALEITEDAARQPGWPARA